MPKNHKNRSADALAQLSTPQLEALVTQSLDDDTVDAAAVAAALELLAARGAIAAPPSSSDEALQKLHAHWNTPDGDGQRLFSGAPPVAETAKKSKASLLHWGRAAAAIVLVLLTAFGSLMGFSARARALVASWFRTENEGSSVYEYTIDGAQGRYRLGDLPAGYQPYAQSEVNGCFHALYRNEKGQLLTFIYANDAHGLLQIDVKNYTQEAVLVNGSPATLYVSCNASEGNVLVWVDTVDGAFFLLNGFFSPEALVALAEGVQLQES